VGMIALSNSYLAQNLLGTMRFAAASRLVDHYMSLPYQYYCVEDRRKLSERICCIMDSV
jgi:hypothetical protein